MTEPTTPAPITVHEAWAAAMADIGAVGKTERNADQGFMFRGIEQVQNAVGPAFRAHGVFIVPTDATLEAERYTTTKGAKMHSVIAHVTFTIYHSGGGSFTAKVHGQAADSGDKAVSKAYSVALRTLLTQALMIPTNDPDPDAEKHERADDPPAPAYDPLKAARDAVWVDTREHCTLDPDSDRGTSQRRSIFRVIMNEMGTSPMEANRDALFTAHTLLTKGLWKATRDHGEPGVDPDSPHGHDQRIAVLRSVLAEAGTTLKAAQEDHLRQAHATLTTGVIPRQAGDTHE